MAEDLTVKKNTTYLQDGAGMHNTPPSSPVVPHTCDNGTLGSSAGKQSAGDPSTSQDKPELQGVSLGITRRPSNMTGTLLEQLPSRQQLAASSSLTMGRASHTVVSRQKSKRHKPGYATMRLPHGKEFNPEDIASSLLSDPDFVDGNEGDQNQNIKELPLNLSIKRTVRNKVKRTASQRKQTSKLYSWKSVQDSCGLNWKRFTESLAELGYSMELWKGHLKTIEGKFGTGVTSYFLFLKWLLLLNIPMFLLSFCLVVLPQIIYNIYRNKSEPPACHSNETFTGVELLTGDGWFTGTVLYYGCYLSGTIYVTEKLPYNMQYAYLCVFAAYYLFILIAVLYSLTKSYKENFIDTSGTVKFNHVIKILSGWDHNITSYKTASIKHLSIYKELQEYLESQKKRRQARTRRQWCGVVWFRIFANLLSLGLLCSSGYLIWFISKTQSLKTEVPLLNDLILPLTISAMNFILPFAFSLLAGWEKYRDPRVELYLTMLRTSALYAVTLGVLMAFWLTGVECLTASSGSNCRQCWESFLGREIYKLVIMDFIFILLLTFFSEFIYGLMSQSVKNLKKPEFNIGRNTLYLVYAQTLIWIGSYYSPLLPVLAIIKVIIIFYIKRVSVVRSCAVPSRAWRGGQTHTVIMAIVLFTLMLCFITIAYSLAAIRPSEVCGPYQGFNTTYEIINNKIASWRLEVPVVGTVVDFVTAREFLACILIALIVAVYYTSVMAKGLKDMVMLMEKQIRLEGEDKMFLLRLMQQTGRERPVSDTSVLQPEPVPSMSPSPADMTSPSPTWSGRRKFAKDAVKERPESGTPAGSPRSSRYETPLRAVRDSPAQVRHRTPLSTEIFNQNYANSPRQSAVEVHRDSIVSSPSGPSTPDVANPAYAEGSPTSRPRLPYPAFQYDFIS